VAWDCILSAALPKSLLSVVKGLFRVTSALGVSLAFEAARRPRFGRKPQFACGAEALGHQVAALAPVGRRDKPRLARSLAATGGGSFSGHRGRCRCKILDADGTGQPAAIRQVPNHKVF